MELRTKEMLTSMGLYTLLTLVVYYVALSQTGNAFDVRLIAGGLLWLAFLFTSMLGLNRSLVHEKDQGCLEALLLSPVDRPVIFFAKATGNLVFLLIVEVLTLPLFWLMFLSGSNKQIAGPWWMIALALVVGSIGIAGMGTLLATMSVNTTGKDFILAVLFVPVMFPLLLGVVSATSAVIIGEPGVGHDVLADDRYCGGLRCDNAAGRVRALRIRHRRLSEGPRRLQCVNSRWRWYSSSSAAC